jgi:hypothetical protein
MKFLNEIMNSIDSKEGAKSATVYEEYYNFIAKLFSNVYDESWMNLKVIDSSTNLLDMDKMSINQTKL